MDELPLLERVRHICNTGNLFLHYKDKIELVVEKLDEEKQEQLRQLNCNFKWVERGNFYIVTVPKSPKIDFKKRITLLLGVFAAILAILFSEKKIFEDVYYFLYDLVF